MTKGKLIGTLVHSAVGAVLAFIGAAFWMVGVAFWLKEYGEAKYKLPGSIWTFDKQKEMVAYAFKGFPQWVAPALAALATTKLIG